jgi:hypothetical protein
MFDRETQGWSFLVIFIIVAAFGKEQFWSCASII